MDKIATQKAETTNLDDFEEAFFGERVVKT